MDFITVKPIKTLSVFDNFNFTKKKPQKVHINN